MVLIAAAMALARPGTEGATMLREWGRETVEAIRRDFYSPDQKLFREEWRKGAKPGQVAFNWSVGVTLSALNAATRADRGYAPFLREFANATHRYWNPAPPVPGYDVLPGPKSADRYYDDNAWMVMAMVETHEALGDPIYLRWASESLRFVLSGEDEKLGGGIYWKEAEKTSKNTCSNAPSAAACLAVYRHTHDPALLAKAISLYSWTKSHLMDPSDHLFWDNIALNGRIEKTKWSYNTALMIRTASELYGLTRLPSYRDDALAMERASLAHWFKDGKLHDAGRFAHLLMESWKFRRGLVPGGPQGNDEFLDPLNYLRANRLSDGHYPDRWDDPVPRRDDRVELIDQASVARAYFEAAEYLVQGGGPRRYHRD